MDRDWDDELLCSFFLVGWGLLGLQQNFYPGTVCKLLQVNFSQETAGCAERISGRAQKGTTLFLVLCGNLIILWFPIIIPNL